MKIWNSGPVLQLSYSSDFYSENKFSSVQSLSCVPLFATPWTAACQASLSFTISWSLLRLMSIESVMPSNHLVLCRPLLLPSIFPSIRVFSNESALHIRWPKYWTFSFSISLSSEYSGLISFRKLSLLDIRFYNLLIKHILLKKKPCPRSGGCTGAGGPRGATPHARSGGAAVGRYPSSKVRSSGCTLLEQPWRDTLRTR